MAVDHRPVAGRDEREEIADAFVEPFTPAGGGQVNVFAPRIVLKGAGVVKEADARRLFARLQHFVSRVDQRSQPGVAPVVLRTRGVPLRRRAPINRQHDVDPGVHHVGKLGFMPRF